MLTAFIRAYLFSFETQSDEPPLTPQLSLERAMESLTVAEDTPSGRLLVKESPCFRLLELLDELGLRSLSSTVMLGKTRARLNPFQEVAIKILVWGGGLIENPEIESSKFFALKYKGKEYIFMLGRGREKPDAVYSLSAEKPLRGELLHRLSTSRPLIILDLSLLLEHVHSTEYISLRRQIAASLSVIRRYLWDRHLVLTSAPPGLRSWLSSALGRALVRCTSLSTRDFLEVLGVRRAVLLDPGATEELTAEDVLSAEAFIIGGIVDRIPRKGLTARIAEKLGNLVHRRKLVLRGSIIGVPHRINMIVELLLRARYEYNGDVERAITSVMSPRDARMRAYVEVGRYMARYKTRLVPVSLYHEMRKWLPLSFKDFVRAVRMAGGKLEKGGGDDQQRPLSSPNPR